MILTIRQNELILSSKLGGKGNIVRQSGKKGESGYKKGRMQDKNFVIFSSLDQASIDDVK